MVSKGGKKGKRTRDNRSEVIFRCPRILALFLSLHPDWQILLLQCFINWGWCFAQVWRRFFLCFFSFHLPDKWNVQTGFFAQIFGAQIFAPIFAPIFGAQIFAPIFAQIFGAQIFVPIFAPIFAPIFRRFFFDVLALEK